MRERRITNWWPAATLAAFIAAATAVVAGILTMGGGNEEQLLPNPASQSLAPTGTATAGSVNAAEGCPSDAVGPGSEPTLFDDLSRGARRDGPNFEVSFGGGVGDAAAGSHADLTVEMSVGAGNVAPKAFYILIPSQWGITPGCQIPIGLAVGSLRWDALVGRDGNPCNEPAPLLFTMVNASTDPSNTVDFLDRDHNGMPDFAEDKDRSGRDDVIEKYPEFLNRLFPGRAPMRRTVGLFRYTNPPILAQSLLFASLDGSKGTTLVILLQNLGDPEAIAGQSGFTDYCTPSGFSMTDFGTTPSGAPLYTNPPAGEYQLILTAFGERDADHDGIENALDTCPFDVNVGNPRVRGDGDADEDGLDAACDPNDFESNLDEDSDGYLNRGDICPLVKAEDSSTQRDRDGDQIGDECDTSGNGPTVADGDVSLVIRAADVTIR